MPFNSVLRFGPEVKGDNHILRKGKISKMKFIIDCILSRKCSIRCYKRKVVAQTILKWEGKQHCGSKGQSAKPCTEWGYLPSICVESPLNLETSTKFLCRNLKLKHMALVWSMFECSMMYINRMTRKMTLLFDCTNIYTIGFFFPEKNDDVV